MPRYRTDFRAWQNLGDEYQDRLARFPDLKREFLRSVTEKGRQLILAEYMFRTPQELGYAMPTKTTGLYGEQLEIKVAVGPKRSWAAITARASYARFIEGGRGEGGVDVGALQEWAMDRFGFEADDPRTRAIISKIRFDGIRARQLFHYALDPSTISGRMWDDFIAAAADNLLAVAVQRPFSATAAIVSRGVEARRLAP